MKVLIAFVLVFEAAFCYCQHPTITFGSLKDSIVEKEDLLLNEGIIFSNDTASNIACLKAVDFRFRIVKLNGDTIEIESNNSSDLFNENRYERAVRRFDKGKRSSYFNRASKYNGLNKFNSQQLKAIKKMKSGESVLIDSVTTIPSSCSCIGRIWNARLKYTIK